jgi:hypothetical protein
MYCRIQLIDTADADTADADTAGALLTATYKEEVVLFMIWASTAVQKQNK